MTTLVSSLDHPAYHQAIRLRGYNAAVTACQAATDADAARVLRHANPDWTSADHLALFEAHEAARKAQQAEWNRLIDAASMETFGRPWRIFDYLISGIGRNEFSEEKKTALRFAAHAATSHGALARAHKAASRGRR